MNVDRSENLKIELKVVREEKEYCANGKLTGAVLYIAANHEHEAYLSFENCWYDKTSQSSMEDLIYHMRGVFDKEMKNVTEEYKRSMIIQWFGPDGTKLRKCQFY